MYQTSRIRFKSKVITMIFEPIFEADVCFILKSSFTIADLL